MRYLWRNLEIELEPPTSPSFHDNGVIYCYMKCIRVEHNNPAIFTAAPAPLLDVHFCETKQTWDSLVSVFDTDTLGCFYPPECPGQTASPESMEGRGSCPERGLRWLPAGKLSSYEGIALQSSGVGQLWNQWRCHETQNITNHRWILQRNSVSHSSDKELSESPRRATGKQMRASSPKEPSKAETSSLIHSTIIRPQ